MKYITVRLTEDQIDEVVHALEEDINPNFPASNHYNAFIQRIINKLAKAKNL